MPPDEVAPAICAYDSHREFDWRPVDAHDGARWVCGRCHPPPGFPCSDLRTRAEGYVNRGRVAHIVRRDPSEPVRRFTGTPAREAVADLMSIIERLTRPNSRAEADRFARDLGRALDRLGVARGERFVLAKRTDDIQAIPLAEVQAPRAGAARNGDPATSRRAAANVLPRSGTQRRQVIDALVVVGDNGLISDELAEITGIDYRSVTPRIGELKNDGWVRATSRTRKSTKNADSEVLVLTDAALLALRGAPPNDSGALFDTHHKPGSAITEG